MRGMDHLVVPTRDLEGLVGQFRRLGFTVGSRNRHPWGTENHIIQFGSSFFELLGFAQDFVAPAVDEPAYPFAGFLNQWVDRSGAGVAMAVLQSLDARADAAAFRQMGIGSGRLLPFSRSARAADGTDKTVAFTIAFAEAPELSDIGFFTCEQHRPENFWNPAVQTHPNGALDLTGLVIVTENPQDDAGFLTAFADAGPAIAAPDAMSIPLRNGRIELLTPSRFSERYGQEVRGAPGEPRVAACLLVTRSLAPTAAWCSSTGLEVKPYAGRLAIPASVGDCALIFEDGSTALD